MRKGILAAWLVLPLGAWAYHEGPGQDRLKLDDVDATVREATAHVAAERWPEAVAAYELALSTLPAERADVARRLRLERAKAQMLASKLPVAHADLNQLVDDLLAADDAEPALLDEARAALANAQYYMTWLMRLEGMPRDKWEPEIDAARQTYRLLAERAEAGGDTVAVAERKKDLESAIRLARMELKDLQGLPLPSQ